MALISTSRRGNTALALAGALGLLGSALCSPAVLAQAQRPDAGTFQRLQKESARPYTPDPNQRAATPGSAPSDATAAVEAAAARPKPPQTAPGDSPAATTDGKVYRISAGDLEQLRPLPERKPPLSTSTLDHTVIGIALPRFVNR